MRAGTGLGVLLGLIPFVSLLSACSDGASTNGAGGNGASGGVAASGGGGASGGGPSAGAGGVATGGTAGNGGGGLGGAAGGSAGNSGSGGASGSGGSAGTAGAGGEGEGGEGGGATAESCSAVPTSASATLISNGAFDLGTNDWIAFSGGTLAAAEATACSGAAGVVSGRTKTSNGPGQSLLGKISNGDIIGVAGWVRIAGAATAQVKITLKIAADTNSYDQVASVTASSDDWVFISGSAQADWSGTPTEAVVYFEGPDAGVDILIDNVYGMKRGPVGGAGTGNEDGTVSLSVQPATTYQTLEGFGASAAWFMNKLTSHAKKAEIYPLLFEDLGLDILRFRNRYQRTNETVNLGDEKAILDAATASLGHAPKVLLTSWSPPAALKANADDDCDQADKDAKTCTLHKVDGAFDYAGFANYWADSLGSYANAGITPDWISLQNEPDYVPTTWEGCKFDPTESADFPGFDAALVAVSDRLASEPSAPGIIGPETLGIHYGRVQSYLSALDQSRLFGIAHHIYEMGNDGVWDWTNPGPDSFVDEMFGVGLAAGSKPTFQTEFNTDGDGGNTGGFETAWLIHNSLAEQGASAFLYWELIWSSTANARGLVFLNDTETYTVRQQYYAVKHYAFFTEPGDVRVSADSNLPGIRSTAFLSPDGNRLVVVALNVGDVEKTLKLGTGAFTATSSSAVRSVFSGTQAYWTATALGAENSLSMPPDSVVTAVFEK